MSNNDNGGKWVGKNWLIGALILIVSFLAGMGINDVLGRVNNTAEKIYQQEMRITALEANYKTIIEKLDEIKREMRR